MDKLRLNTRRTTWDKADTAASDAGITVDRFVRSFDHPDRRAHAVADIAAHLGVLATEIGPARLLEMFHEVGEVPEATPAEVADGLRIMADAAAAAMTKE